MVMTMVLQLPAPAVDYHAQRRHQQQHEQQQKFASVIRLKYLKDFFALLF